MRAVVCETLHQRRVGKIILRERIFPIHALCTIHRIKIRHCHVVHSSVSKSNCIDENESGERLHLGRFVDLFVEFFLASFCVFVNRLRVSGVSVSPDKKRKIQESIDVGVVGGGLYIHIIYD